MGIFLRLALVMRLGRGNEKQVVPLLEVFGYGVVVEREH